MNDPRGSIWRKWDLHVHTPYSYLNNGFGNNYDTYVQKLFKKAIAEDIHAIGITDYFTIEGYKKIKTEYIQKEEKLAELFSPEEIEKIKTILILPNIEFRLDKLVNGNRINYHVLFSEELSIDTIEEDFLFDLDFVYEGNPQADDEKWKLKPRNIEALGKKLKEEHAGFATEGDMCVGMKCAVVDDKQITKLLSNKKSKFSGKYLLFAPSDEDLSEISWNGQGHNIRKVLIQKSDGLLASNPNTVKWGLGYFNKSVDDYIKEFGSLKPAIWGSDAHNFDELFKPSNDRYCWIKTDKTFEGLKQITIEPESRVFIGERPDSLIRVEQNPTKYINQLEINKVEDSTLDEIWFEDLSPIPLNSDLVAIIGNKGNGKSALADIIGLVGNTRNYVGFSFLHKEKFRKKRPNRSESFEARLKWENETIDGPIHLSNNPDEALSEKVKYIPQSYLETLCTETDEKKFSEELKKVIFSHVDESEKLGKYSLDELISYKSEEINKGIQGLRNKLSEVNVTIESLEAKSTPDFRSKIEDSLKLKKEELGAHKNNRPVEIKEPKKDLSVKEEQEAIGKQIEEIKEAQKKFEDDIQNKKEVRKNLALKLAILQKFDQSLGNFKEQYDNLKEQYESELAEYDIKLDDVVKFAISKQIIDNGISEAKMEIQTIDNELNEKKEGSLANEHADNERKIKDLQGKLDEPTRKFQEYQDKLKAWEVREKEIIGADDKQGTIKFYEKIVKYLDESLNVEIENRKQERIKIVKSICSEKFKIVQLYKDLYKPVTEFISEYGELMKDYKINLDVSIQLDDFHDKFFARVSRGAKGSFIGTDEGHNILDQITDGVNFNSEDAILSFLDEVLDHLDYDKRNGEERRIADQLKQEYEVKDFYDFLFGLDYLVPNYKLRLGEKNISELSPGERGALLLIFYLLLDKQNIPLIIDQPEENLDNQSVYRILVKFIKEAKKKRQIIIVTHNPNLAVVCDAEQIICVKIEKDNKNRFTLISGGIENPQINAKTVEILEGTFPAFDNRTEKYKVFKYLN
ncbi:TrlF family AAA-like ATPase [Negadavirga shengliensis]|uniref:TrlF family AAA-like ATPase n=1 Tax=Negadavirga shengliensis TaxID=1389218 RepID=A0ABV9T078_9BACT